MPRSPNEKESAFAMHAPDQLFVRSSAVVSRVVGGETLIVPIRGKVGDLASIYTFNETGSLIWQSLESPQTLADLIDTVEREFEVNQEQAQQDVRDFVNDMLSVGLLDLCPSIAISAIGMSETQEEICRTPGSR